MTPDDQQFLERLRSISKSHQPFEAQTGALDELS
jgi:hypothetical protein